MKRIAGVIVATAALFAAQAAHANCGGNLINVKPLIWGDGTRLGEVQLYYNPANGRNCARTVHGGETWGQPRTTDIFIETCTRAVFNANGGTCPPGSPSDYWSGQPSYHTSPVSLPGSGRCVDVLGGIERYRNQGTFTAARIAGHCG